MYEACYIRMDWWLHPLCENWIRVTTSPWKVFWNLRRAQSKSLCKKMASFTKQVRSCRQIGNDKGNPLHPRNMEAVKVWMDQNQHRVQLYFWLWCLFNYSNERTDISHVSSFVAVYNWAKVSQTFTNRLNHSRTFLKRHTHMQERQKKSALQHIPLQNVSWGTEQNGVIAMIQDSLHNEVELASPKW